MSHTQTQEEKIHGVGEPMVTEHEHKQDAGLVDQFGSHRKTDPREIALVRKLDWMILPIIWTMYWFNYLDRNAITVARLDNLEEELGLQGAEYQTCVSILFVGYILGQVPANMIMTRVRPSLFMAAWMALWAVVSTLTGICTDFKGLLLTRFFLGVTEAPFYPGALYLLSLFYTRKELATRISILFTANICGTAFAGLIAIGVFKMSGVAGLSGWRWLFILQGILTFLIAVLSAFVLPDEPLQTRWLSEEERQLAHGRMEEDTVQRKENQRIWAGLIECLKDSKLWVLIFMQHLHLAASGYKSFFPTIVETLGYDRNATLALTCPPYLLSGVVAIVVAVFGFVLACATLNTGARYFAMCVFASGVYACNSVIIGWVASTCGQTREKKAISLSIVNTLAVVGSIYTPYLWPSSDSPRYVIAMSSSAAFSAAAAVLAWVLRRMLIVENRKIRQMATEETNFYPY